MVGGIGLAAPLAWLRRSTQGPGRRRIAPVGVAAALALTLGAASVCCAAAAQAAYRELARQEAANDFLARAASVCRAVPRHPCRVLVSNALYNPLRFQLQGSPAASAAHVHRLIEEFHHGRTGIQIADFDVLCLGLKSGETAALIDAASQRPAAWRAVESGRTGGKPFYIFVQNPAMPARLSGTGQPAASEKGSTRIRSMDDRNTGRAT